MNIEVNLENLTPEEQEQFKALVEKATKSKSRVWKPEISDLYYYIDAVNDTTRITETFYDSAYGLFNYSVGNCFQTKEEAEFAIEKLKVIAEMRRYIAEHDDVRLNWTNEAQKKYSLIFDHYFCCVSYRGHNMYTYSPFCASSGNIIEDMIKEIGEDRIKKYYFGVEENE